MNERHPVQALVWGIVSLVVALGGLLILIAPAIFSIVYSIVNAADSSVPSEAIQAIRQVYFILTVVFGSFSLIAGVASLVIRGATAKLYSENYEDGRFRGGVITRKIAFPVAIITIVLACLVTVLVSLILNGILH
jgi:hypothetical protein